LGTQHFWLNKGFENWQLCKYQAHLPHHWNFLLSDWRNSGIDLVLQVAQERPNEYSAEFISSTAATTSGALVVARA